MKNKCKNCYVKIKEYTYLKGLLLTIFLQFVLMIPILNISILKWVEENGYTFNEGERDHNFWEGCWYNYKKVKVEEYKNGKD